MLSDKITVAYNRHLQTSTSTEKSINRLFSQLHRLNQWSAENKAQSRSEGGASSGKMASDLKESLKDLFRYINNKNIMNTPKSVERAIKQSGTFLESRTNSQTQQQQNQPNKPSPELTLHKDFKANLNRVLTTALYNLAKIKLTQQMTPGTLANTSTSTLAKAANSAAAATSTGSNPQMTTPQKQTGENLGFLKNDLIANIKNRLMKFSAGRTAATNLPQLEIITREILKNVQSALSRTQLNQLTNLRPDSSTQQWLFEVPVMNNKEVDVFSMFLKEKKSDEEDKTKQSSWSLVLQFSIGTLGKMRAMLTWDKNNAKVRFIAEQSNTASLVNTELEYFQKKLSDQGVLFQELTVEHAELDDLSIQFSTSKNQ